MNNIDLLLMLYAFILGICYRLSEVEYIWYTATTKRKGKYIIPITQRDWLKKDNAFTRWLSGTVHRRSTLLSIFNRITFSLFSNGYHFFGNIPATMLFLVLIDYYISLEIVLAMIVSRWLGTIVGLMILIKEDK